jgi:hypothetical protein
MRLRDFVAWGLLFVAFLGLLGAVVVKLRRLGEADARARPALEAAEGTVVGEEPKQPVYWQPGEPFNSGSVVAKPTGRVR